MNRIQALRVVSLAGEVACVHFSFDQCQYPKEFTFAAIEAILTIDIQMFQCASYYLTKHQTFLSLKINDLSQLSLMRLYEEHENKVS